MCLRKWLPVNSIHSWTKWFSRARWATGSRWHCLQIPLWPSCTITCPTPEAMGDGHVQGRWTWLAGQMGRRGGPNEACGLWFPRCFSNSALVSEWKLPWPVCEMTSAKRGRGKCSPVDSLEALNITDDGILQGRLPGWKLGSTMLEWFPSDSDGRLQKVVLWGYWSSP